jgi:hypothetical protein
MFQTNFVDKITTHFTFSNLFQNLSIFGDEVQKYYRAGEATDDNMTYAQLHVGYLRLQTHCQNT